MTCLSDTLIEVQPHLLFLVLVAHATSFFVPPLPEFTGQAEIVVRATPTKVRSQWVYTERGKSIYTYADLRVSEVIRGETAEFLTARRAGGIIGSVGQEIAGSVVLQEGKESVFFLGGKQADHSREVVGMELGRLDYQNGPTGPTVSGGILGFGPGIQEAGHDHPGEEAKPMKYADLVSLVKSQPAPVVNPADTPLRREKNDTAPTKLTQSPEPDLHRGNSPPPSNDEQPQIQAKSAGQETPQGSQFKGILWVFAVSLIFFLFMRTKR